MTEDQESYYKLHRVYLLRFMLIWEFQNILEYHTGYCFKNNKNSAEMIVHIYVTTARSLQVDKMKIDHLRNGHF